MAMFQYVAYHPVQRTPLGRLTVREPNWVETIGGNTTFTGKVTIPPNEARISQLREALEPDNSAVYVKGRGAGRWSWGGVIVNQQWNSDNNEISFTATDWRSWLYSVMATPKIDLSADNVYAYNQVEQLTIARSLVALATAGGAADGRPTITLGSNVTTRLRDLNFRGTDFRAIGALIDSMAQRDDGFDWDIGIRSNSAGVPVPSFDCYYPQRGGVITGLLFSTASNIIQVEDLQRDTTNRRSRVWATGEGPSAESLPYVQDDDADLPLGFTLMREVQQNYNGVIELPTLADHARALRLYLSAKTNLFKFAVRLAEPDYFGYAVGDRCRLRVKDSWYDIDLDNVRIVERNVRPDENGGIAWLTVDLNDNVLPDTDPEGAV